MKHIYFVRHGESVGNLAKTYQGPDVPLSEAGKEGAKAVSERIAHLPIDIIVASPFMRTRETAEYISKRIGKSIKTVNSFHEILNAKSVWGKSRNNEETEGYAKEREIRFTDPSWSPDGAENYFAVLERLKLSITYLENLEEEHIVVVSHGNFLNQLTSYLLTQQTDEINAHMSVYGSLNVMSNVAITEFLITDGVWKLFMWNDHAHFAE